MLAQCIADWLWLLPGLVGLAVLALALASGGEEGANDFPAERWSLGRIASVAGVGVALVSIAFLFLGNVYVRKARVDAFRSPEAELSAARTAAWFNPVAVSPLYLQASALESQGSGPRRSRRSRTRSSSSRITSLPWAYWAISRFAGATQPRLAVITGRRWRSTRSTSG